jgi:hypothetical protein
VSRRWLGYWHAMSIAVFALCFVLSLRSMAATHSAVPERRVGAWAPPVQARLTAQRVTEEVHDSQCSQERLVGSCSCRSMADKMELGATKTTSLKRAKQKSRPYYASCARNSRSQPPNIRRAAAPCHGGPKSIRRPALSAHRSGLTCIAYRRRSESQIFYLIIRVLESFDEFIES